MNFKVFYIFLFVWGALVFQNPAQAFEGSDIKETNGGVYVGTGKTPAGEAVYFAAEPVDSSNVQHWRKYGEQCKYMANPNRGVISGIAYLTISLEAPPSYNDMARVTGFDETEHNEYIQLIKKNVDKKTVAAMQNSDTGPVAFHIEDDGNHYVIYASKVLVVGRYVFPAGSGSFTNLKNFNKAYENILMCVRSENINNSIVYNNRGIFRNPKSFVDGGYKNLSLALHGFSAAVMNYKFGDAKKYMAVNPVSSMQGILVKSLKPGQLFMGTSKSKREQFSDFLPLLHIYDFGDNQIKKIAKEGVNLKDYINRELPAEYTQGSGDQLDNGLDGDLNMIRIDALIQFYKGIPSGASSSNGNAN